MVRELGCDWHTVNDAVVAFVLVEDPCRIKEVSALGLDETLFCRKGRWRRQHWCTSIVDVTPGAGVAQLLDLVPGRNATRPSAWLDARPQAWRDAIRYGVIDLSGPYRKTFEDSLPEATLVADPFHVAKLANTKPDECRRRVQNETLGHRDRKDDPLYRARRLLTKAHERLDDNGETKLLMGIDHLGGWVGEAGPEPLAGQHSVAPGGRTSRSRSCACQLVRSTVDGWWDGVL